MTHDKQAEIGGLCAAIICLAGDSLNGRRSYYPLQFFIKPDRSRTRAYATRSVSHFLIHLAAFTE